MPRQASLPRPGLCFSESLRGVLLHCKECRDPARQQGYQWCRQQDEQEQAAVGAQKLAPCPGQAALGRAGCYQVSKGQAYQCAEKTGRTCCHDNPCKKDHRQAKFDEISLLNTKGEASWQKMICFAHNQMEEEAYESLKNRVKHNKQRAKLLNDPNLTREVKTDEYFQTAWVNILFGNYETAKKNLEKLKEIQEQQNDPTAMYGYHGLTGMVHLMEGNAERAIENFEKGRATAIYFNYFKGLALKSAGREEEAEKIFKDLAKINFSNWNIAIVRRLANKQLGVG